MPPNNYSKIVAFYFLSTFFEIQVKRFEDLKKIKNTTKSPHKFLLFSNDLDSIGRVQI